MDYTKPCEADFLIVQTLSIELKRFAQPLAGSPMNKSDQFRPAVQGEKNGMEFCGLLHNTMSLSGWFIVVNNYSSSLVLPKHTTSAVIRDFAVLSRKYEGCLAQLGAR